MLGGVTVQVLIRLQASRAALAALQVLYDLAGRVQLVMVLSGSALLLLTGILLWIGERLAFFTGWLLLGFLLYLAIMALDGAYLSPNLDACEPLRGKASRPRKLTPQLPQSRSSIGSSWSWCSS